MQTKTITRNEKANSESADPILAIDLVCGMELDVDKVKASTEYNGEVYYFCAVYCKKHFTANPEKYTG